ncbi:hypothetical protein SteCoe_35130 [Stentor coeruleus]|uniref:Uncharacterized protein n=1 Tax=Stentor coeruleus TaxID=5963 RepID=A0A1R2ASZ5_9CILI|nr:hypothetical protein SteCoe_35130 [Stentor coeruleus]
MRRCSVKNCEIEPKFECFCNNEFKILCENHNFRHISEVNTTHSNKYLNLEEQSKIQKKIIEILEEKLETVLHNKKIFFEVSSKFITDLVECINEKVRQLINSEKTLQRLITDVTYNIDEIRNSNLENALRMTHKSFKAECKNWDFINISMNTLDAKNIANEWIKIDDQIDIWFAKDTVKPFTSTLKQEEKKYNDSYSNNKQEKDTINKVYNRSSTIKTDPLLNNYNVLICKNKHELEWLVLAPYNNYANSDSIWITCKNCEAKFSTACWSCSICNYNVCEKCGINIGIPSPKLRCERSHELFWRPDANLYYELKNNINGFKCKSCCAIKHEAHWHCRECNFDICISCGKNQKQVPYIYNPRCLKNHQLIKNPTSASFFSVAISCAKCRNDISKCSYYACNTCLYFICNKCYDLMNFSAAGHPVLFCQSEHPSRWVQKSTFKCNYCLINFNQEHFSCSSCNYNICYECSNLLFNYVTKGCVIVHGQDDHRLEWSKNSLEKNNKKTITCSQCCKNYLGTGMFYCRICNFDICMLCAMNIDRNADIYQRRSLHDEQLFSIQSQLRSENPFWKT